MDFDFSEDQQMLREACRELLERESPLLRVRELAETDDGFDRALWARTAELGWAGLVVPEEHGGAGLGLIDALVLAEEHGRLAQPGPLLSGTTVAQAIAELGSDAQCAAWLPALAEGRRVAAWAHLAAGAGEAADELAFDAARDGDTFTLSGVARPVVDAPSAGLLLASARTPDGPGLFVLAADTEGVDVRASEGLDLARRFGVVAFDGVRVDADAVLAADPNGAAIERVLDVALVLQCGESIGAGRRLLEMTVQHTGDRVQFGRAVGSFQAIRHRCADMRIALENAETATRYATLAVSERRPDAAEAVHIAKSYVGDAMTDLAGEALQLHGGIGFTWEHDAHLYHRRLQANRVLYGDPAWHNEQLARLLESGEPAA